MVWLLKGEKSHKRTVFYNFY